MLCIYTSKVCTRSNCFSRCPPSVLRSTSTRHGTLRIVDTRTTTSLMKLNPSALRHLKTLLQHQLRCFFIIVVPQVTKSIVIHLPNFFFSPCFSPHLPPPLFRISLATPKLRFTSPTRPKAQHHYHLMHAIDPFVPLNHFYNPFLSRP